jgi:cytochrome c biogenesis protein CcmG, thiol:disulfide interchange protein DsbE
MRLFLGITCAVLLCCAAPLGAAELKPWGGGQPDSFELTDLDGRQHRLADYRGKVVLINFWATWCEPCRDEIPAMAKLKDKFAGRPFVILGINADEPEARIRKFLSLMPVTFPVLLDRGGKTAKAWRVRVLPASFLVDPQGNVRYSVIGELDWSAREVADHVARLLPPG